MCKRRRTSSCCATSRTPRPCSSLLWLRLPRQVLRDHQTIYEPPALPSRLQAEFGEPHYGKQPTQPEDARRPARPPLATIESESIVQEGGDGASARAPSPAPASMASEAMAFLHRVFGAAPQVGCSGRRSGPDLFAT